MIKTWLRHKHRKVWHIVMRQTIDSMEAWCGEQADRQTDTKFISNRAPENECKRCLTFIRNQCAANGYAQIR